LGTDDAVVALREQLPPLLGLRAADQLALPGPELLAARRQVVAQHVPALALHGLLDQRPDGRTEELLGRVAHAGIGEAALGAAVDRRPLLPGERGFDHKLRHLAVQVREQPQPAEQQLRPPQEHVRHLAAEAHHEVLDDLGARHDPRPRWVLWQTACVDQQHAIEEREDEGEDLRGLQPLALGLGLLLGILHQSTPPVPGQRDGPLQPSLLHLLRVARYPDRRVLALCASGTLSAFSVPPRALLAVDCHKPSLGSPAMQAIVPPPSPDHSNRGAAGEQRPVPANLALVPRAPDRAPPAAAPAEIRPTETGGARTWLDVTASDDSATLHSR